jgi:FkbM family methyltransferase
MKLSRGVWLPDGDEHFAGMMERVPRQRLKDGRSVGVYQWEKVQSAIEHCKKRRVALDIGAHVGLWSMWLADAFKSVIAFEPVRKHAECWSLNVRQPNAELREHALGAEPGYIGIASGEENTGNAHVSGHGNIPVVTLDSLELPRVDLIKIDTEGFESAVIQGGRETIMRCRPIMAVESNGQHERYGLPEPVGLLESMGAKVLHRMRHDVIMGW